MFWNLHNCVCVAVAQRTPGTQGAAAREAEHVTEERAGQAQVTDRTDIRGGRRTDTDTQHTVKIN